MAGEDLQDWRVDLALPVQGLAVPDGLLPLAPVLSGQPLPPFLHDVLFRPDGLACHALLDASERFGLSDMIARSGLAQDSLWSGQTQEEFGDHAPYLVTLEPDAPLTRRLFTASDRPRDLWGRVQPLFLRSALPLATIRAQMRRVAKVSYGGVAGQRARRGLLRFWQTDLMGPVLRLGPMVPGVFAHWQVAFAGTTAIWFDGMACHAAVWPGTGDERRLPTAPLDPAEFRLLTLAARDPKAETDLRAAFQVPWYRAEGGPFDRLFDLRGIARVPLIAACEVPSFRRRVGSVLGAGLSDRQTAFALSRLYGGV